ncbi:MAG: hypothetical protein BRC22_02475 [Parcubacteria group bacterium QH_9_35_7]|nr:MAG: hypothetical protein BRC22_02475 [Parcubacteria group bacterium QH_9_35_7]
MFSEPPLKKEEDIIYIIRSYGLSHFWWFVLTLILIGTPFFFMFWLFRQGWLGKLLFAIPLITGVVLLVRVLFYWRKNKMIITTHGLIDLHYENAFNKIVSRADFDEIDDVSGEISGIGGTIFRYGTINIKTGAGSVEIIKKNIKDPIGLQAEIKDLRRKYKRRSGKDPNEIILENLKHLDKKELIKVLNSTKEMLEQKQEK